MIKTLIAYGANLDAKDKLDRKPIEWTNRKQLKPLFKLTRR